MQESDLVDLQLGRYLFDKMIYIIIIYILSKAFVDHNKISDHFISSHPQIVG